MPILDIMIKRKEEINDKNKYLSDCYLKLFNDWNITLKSAKFTNKHMIDNITSDKIRKPKYYKIKAKKA